MKDTPDYIKELQLKIWLSKSPGERLYQFLVDNDKMYQAIMAFKTSSKQNAGNTEIPRKENKITE
jgi:hypothetical protein